MAVILVDAECGVWEDTEGRFVAKTDLPGYHVSTVFLTVDHAWGMGRPIFYETMVFKGEDRGDVGCWRYHTRAAAERGHAIVVAWVRGGMNGECDPAIGLDA